MDTSRPIPVAARSTSTPSRRTLVKVLAGVAGFVALAGQARAQESGFAGEVTAEAAVAYADSRLKNPVMLLLGPVVTEFCGDSGA